jgi:WD40 repeat protein
MRVELNLSVDLSTDGRLAAIGGDGRATLDARDGHAIWPAIPPPPDVSIDEICLLDRLRFSPKSTWLAGSAYSRKLQVFPLNSLEPWQPMIELPGSCEAGAFSRDERLMATSGAALYQTGATQTHWNLLWSSSLPTKPADFGYPVSDVSFSPDETQLLVSHCVLPDGNCDTTLLDAATGAVIRELTELTGLHPRFSPEGSWIVAANKLLHLSTGEARTLGEEANATNPAIFTPDGDIIAGSANGALTRYCRDE